MQQNNTAPATPNLKQFVCIEYPGLVVNVDRMIETLGGINKISEVYSEKNRRMELRHSPENIFCKPSCGERNISSALLIKVTCRRKKKKNSTNTEDPKPTYKTDLLGIVRTTYQFDNLCDFQYLPAVSQSPEGNLVSLYSNLMPPGIVSSNWMYESAYLFLPPAVFTRMDTPQEYRYRMDKREITKQAPQNAICRTRQKRTHYAIFHYFQEEGVPTEALPGAISDIRCKFIDYPMYHRLDEEFKKRPIWSKNALRARLGFPKDKLRYILPTLSYYCPVGPWRNLWVRLGYDPRKNPNSWVYQTFDFRLRQAGGAKTKVEAKRSYSNYILPYKNVNMSKKKNSIIQSLHLGDDSNSPSENGKEAAESKGQEYVSEKFYIFKQGMIPPFRQMFYQYCDVQVPEIQQLLESSILSDSATTCGTNGWLPVGVEVKCRDILSRIIEKTLSERSAEVIGSQELMSESDGEESATEASGDAGMKLRKKISTNF